MYVTTDWCKLTIAWGREEWTHRPSAVRVNIKQDIVFYVHEHVIQESYSKSKNQKNLD